MGPIRQVLLLVMALGGVIGISAFLLFAILGVPPAAVLGVAILGGLMVAGGNSRQPGHPTVSREVSNAAGDLIKRNTVNAIIADDSLAEEQRNALLKHTLGMPTAIPEKDQRR